MKTVKKSIIPLACVAAMWLGHALNGGLSSVGGIIRCAVLSAIAFAVLRIFFPDKLVDAQKEPQPAQKKAVPQPEPERRPRRSRSLHRRRKSPPQRRSWRRSCSRAASLSRRSGG